MSDCLTVEQPSEVRRRKLKAGTCMSDADDKVDDAVISKWGSVSHDDSIYMVEIEVSSPLKEQWEKEAWNSTTVDLGVKHK
jgi:hypothetical protein